MGKGYKLNKALKNTELMAVHKMDGTKFYNGKKWIPLEKYKYELYIDMGIITKSGAIRNVKKFAEAEGIPELANDYKEKPI